MTVLPSNATKSGCDTSDTSPTASPVSRFISKTEPGTKPRCVGILCSSNKLLTHSSLGFPPRACSRKPFSRAPKAIDRAPHCWSGLCAMSYRSRAARAAPMACGVMVE